MLSFATDSSLPPCEGKQFELTNRGGIHICQNVDRFVGDASRKETVVSINMMRRNPEMHVPFLLAGLPFRFGDHGRFFPEGLKMPTTIHDACRNGEIETIRELLAKDPSLVDADDKHQWRPIFHAALQRHVDVVSFLCESGADLSAHDGYVLHYAGEVPGNKEIVKLLVTYGALDAHVRPTDDLSRQFLAALFIGTKARVHSLLGRHPELTTRVDGRGDYPLHHAARNGDTEIVRMLIDNGADVNAINERGHTVLYCAGGHGHLETVRLLLANNADAGVKFAHDGKTLLEWLAQYPDDQRFAEIAKLLSVRGIGA